MTPFEFEVDAVEQKAGAGTFVVRGRCLAGRFGIGSVFDSVFRLTDVRSPNPVRADESSVQLRVDRIVAYRRELNEVDSGLTAMLELSGSGGENVRSGMVLGGRAA
jgi:hypothetical protein